MNPRDLLSQDGHAVLLLCSQLGASGKDASVDPAPFTLSEWNQLAPKIHASSFKKPSGLFGCSAADLSSALNISLSDAERVAGLLERGGQVALELEDLFSRGIWTVTRIDETYPASLKQRLKHQAPPVLFGAGDLALLNHSGIAVIGSRNIDEAGKAFAQQLGRKCAEARTPVVSGGARGTDRLAMEAVIEAGGTAFGVLADSLVQTIRNAELRQLLLDGRLVLLTPYSPTSGFSVGAAMGRNKLIYGLADAAVVVSSDFQKGGTWAGAVEALKAGWCPVFVRTGDEVPNGNRELIKKGAVALEESKLSAIENLPAWLRERAGTKLESPELFPP